MHFQLFLSVAILGLLLLSLFLGHSKSLHISQGYSWLLLVKTFTSYPAVHVSLFYMPSGASSPETTFLKCHLAIFFSLFFFSELQIIRIYCPSHLQVLISIVVLLHECACVSPQEVGEGQILSVGLACPPWYSRWCRIFWPWDYTKSSKALQFKVFIHWRLH